MKKLLLATVCTLVANSAYGADLPPKPLPTKAPAAVSTFPIYAFIGAGVGFSAQRNELTIPDLEVSGSTPKQWPTGFVAGGGLGVTANTAIGRFDVEGRANYDFTRASMGCIPAAGCMGYSKNSWLFQEMVYWAPLTSTPLSFTGWSWTSYVQILPGVGMAQRSVTACMVQLDGSIPCDTKWLNGLDVGVKVEVPLGNTQWAARVTYDYMLYNNEIRHANSPIFTNAFKAQDEQLVMAGLKFGF